MVGFHTRAFVLTWAAACGSGAAGPSSPPVAPPKPVRAAPGAPPAPAAPPELVEVTVDEPALALLTCEHGTAVTAAPAPEPTWFCARLDGTRDGPFVTLFPDATVAIRGRYQAGALDGGWQRNHPGGAIAEHGDYAAGLKHGRWRQLSPTGALLGEYELVRGSGSERRWFDTGALYSEAHYKAGVLDGPSKLFGPDGVQLVSARYIAGKLDGPHWFGTRQTVRFEETLAAGVRRGQRQIWQFGVLIADETFDRKGRYHGPYTLWRNRKVTRVKGQFDHGKRTGDWLWHDREGHKEKQGSYEAGKRDGDWMEWVDDRLVFSGNYSNGRPGGEFVYFDRGGAELGRFTIRGGTGVMLTFHRNRKPSSRQRLVKGVPDGVYQELTAHGKLVVEGQFAAGVRHGRWRELTPDGVPTLEQTWSRGKLDGVVRKLIDGRPSSETTYVDGKAHGPYTEYRLGKPAVTGQFADDRRSGVWTHYSADGAIALSASYRDGVLHGLWRQLTDGAVVEGTMTQGRRTGTWTRTEPTGAVRKLTYRTP